MTSHFFSCFLFLVVTTGVVRAEADKPETHLSKAEATALVKEMKDMMSEFEKGNKTVIIKKTHKSLVEFIGGRKVLSMQMEGIVEMIEKNEMAFLSTDYGKPTQLYQAGGEEVCFVPRVTLMKVQDLKVRSTSFMIAIRGKGKGKWSFLDGAGLRNNPKMLPTLLPKLPKNIELPENNQEVL